MFTLRILKGPLGKYYQLGLLGEMKKQIHFHK